MTESARQHQHDEPNTLSSDGQSSLEYEELKYVETCGDAEERRVFVGGGGGIGSSGTDLQQQLATAAADESLGDEEDEWDPIPFRSSNDDDDDSGVSSIFGFTRKNYMDGIRAWSTGNFGLGRSSSPVAVPSLPAKMNEDDDGDDGGPPGMVRSNSGSLSSGSEADEAMIDDDDDASSEEDGDVIAKPPRRGVSFNEQVRVLPIPPVDAYTPEQRYRMYASRFELRENKVRAKKEYEFDNWDWRNATEEHSMAICPLSGELLHPAHL